MYDFSDFTAQEKKQLQAIVDKYASVEGSYESTMLEGIVHGYCDSGILSDCFSVDDAELVNKYFTEEAQCNASIFDMNTFIVAASCGDEELLCVKVIKEIEAVCDCAETGAAYIGKLMGTINCYEE